MKNGYRVEHKSRARQTYEIYKVENGLDTICYLTDFNGRIEEMWSLCEETGTSRKIDHLVVLQLTGAIVISELKHAIASFELDRDDIEPWSIMRTLLLEPYNTRRLG